MAANIHKAVNANGIGDKDPRTLSVADVQAFRAKYLDVSEAEYQRAVSS